jgi:hypothetical protein
VLDAQRDSRFAGNELVTGWPHIRFYAGAPLCVTRPAGAVSGDGAAAVDGEATTTHRIGTLCVLDTAVEHGGGGSRAHFTVKEKQVRREGRALHLADFTSQRSYDDDRRQPPQ